MLLLLLVLIVVFTIIYLYKKEKESRIRIQNIYSKALHSKRKVKPTGGFYQSPFESINDFLDYAAFFLKSKKHEWIIIAFGESALIREFWVNKGPDKKSVSLYLSFDDILKHCLEKRYINVIKCHNHPVSTEYYDPSELGAYYSTKDSLFGPSPQDLMSGNELKKILNANSINLSEYVMVAGKWRKYI